MKKLIVATAIFIAFPAHAAKIYTNSAKVVNVEHDLFCSAPAPINRKSKKKTKPVITKIRGDFYFDVLHRQMVKAGNDRLYHEINLKNNLFEHEDPSEPPRNCLSVESTIKTKDLNRDNITKLAISSTIWY